MPSTTAWFVVAITVCGIQSFSISTNRKTPLSHKSLPEALQQQASPPKQVQRGDATRSTEAEEPQRVEDNSKVSQAGRGLTTPKDKEEETSMTNHEITEDQTDRPGKEKQTAMVLSLQEAVTYKSTVPSLPNKSLNTQTTPHSNAFDGINPGVSFIGSQKNLTGDSLQIPQPKNENNTGYVDTSVSQAVSNFSGWNNENYQADKESIRHKRIKDDGVTPPLEEENIIDRSGLQRNLKTNGPSDRASVVNTTAPAKLKHTDGEYSTGYDLVPTKGSDSLKTVHKSGSDTLSNKKTKNETNDIDFDNWKSNGNSANSQAAFRGIDNREAANGTIAAQRTDELVASKSFSGPERITEALKPENVKRDIGRPDVHQTVAGPFFDSIKSPVSVTVSKVQPAVIKQIRPAELNQLPKITLSDQSDPIRIRTNRDAFPNRPMAMESRHPSVFVPRNAEHSPGSQTEAPKRTPKMDPPAVFPDKMPDVALETQSEHDMFTSNYKENNNFSGPDNTTDVDIGPLRSVSKMNESNDELVQSNVSNNSDYFYSPTVESQNLAKDHNFYQMTPVEYLLAHQSKTQKEPSDPIVFASSPSNTNSSSYITNNTYNPGSESQSSMLSKNLSIPKQDLNRPAHTINDTIRLKLSKDDISTNSNNFTESISIPMSSRTKPDAQQSQKLFPNSKVPIPTKFSANIPNRSNSSKVIVNKDLLDDARQRGQTGIDKQAVSSTKNSQLIQNSNPNLARLDAVSHSPNQSVEKVLVTNETKSESHPQEAHAPVPDGHEQENSMIQFSDLKSDDRNAAPLQQDFQAPYQDRSRYYRYTVPYYSLVKRKGQLHAKRMNVLPSRSSQRSVKTFNVPTSSGISTRELNNNNYSQFKKQINGNNPSITGVQTAKSYPTLKAYSLVHEIVKSTKSDNKKTDNIYQKKDIDIQQTTQKPKVWYDRVLGLRLGRINPSLNSRRSLNRHKQVPDKQHSDKMSRSSAQPLEHRSGQPVHSKLNKVKHDKASNAREISHTIFSRDHQQPMKSTGSLNTLSRTNAFKDASSSKKGQGILSRPNQSTLKVQGFSNIITDRGLMSEKHTSGESFKFQQTTDVLPSFQRKGDRKSLDLKLSKTTHSTLRAKGSVENVSPLQAPMSPIYNEYHSTTTVKIPTQQFDQTGEVLLSNIDSRTNVLTDTLHDSKNKDSTDEFVKSFETKKNSFPTASGRILLKEKSASEVPEISKQSTRDLSSQTEQENAHHQSERDTSLLPPTSSRNLLPTIIPQKSPVINQRSVNNPRRIVYNENIKSPASVYEEDSDLRPKPFHSLGSLRPGGKNTIVRTRGDPNFKNGKLGQRLFPPLNSSTKKSKPDVQNQERITVGVNTLGSPIPHPLHQQRETINKKSGGHENPTVQPYIKIPNRNTILKTTSNRVHFDTKENNDENITTLNSNSTSYEAAVQDYLSALVDIYDRYPNYDTPPLPFQSLYPYSNPYVYTNPYLYPFAPPNPYVIPGFPPGYSQPRYRGVSLLNSILNPGTSFTDGISPVNQNIRSPSPLSKKSASSTHSNEDKSDRNPESRRQSNGNALKGTTTQSKPSLLSMPITKTGSSGNNGANLRQKPGTITLVDHHAKWYESPQNNPATNFQPPVNFISEKAKNKQFKSFQKTSILPQPAFTIPNGWLPVFPPLYITDPRPLYGPTNYIRMPSLYSSQITQIPATHQIDERDLKAIEHFLLTKRGYSSWGGSNSKSGYYTNTKSYKTNPGVLQGATNGQLTEMDMKAIEHFIYTMPYYSRGNKGGGLGSLKLLTLLS